MTAYSIALHVLGKNLLSLGFLKESKHFITKAHYVVTKMLVLDRKFDLELAIQMDMKAVLDRTREVEGAKGFVQRDTHSQLTEEDIERSLVTIKSGLATVMTEGKDSAQEKFKQVEAEIEQLADKNRVA